MARDLDQYRTQKLRNGVLLRMDKERYVKGIDEEDEGHFNAKDLRPAYQIPKKVYSNSVTQRSTIRITDGLLVLGVVGCNPFAGGQRGCKLKSEKVVGICNINEEFLTSGGEVMIRRLHVVLFDIWQPGTSRSAWKKSLIVPLWGDKRDRQNCNNYCDPGLLIVPVKLLVHLLLTWVRSHLLKFQRSERLGSCQE
ncbi:uncharacterized protein LOC143037339 [Oratosquilla oratoria]|uniref:uncharacterized protein LOC143037339 n=1 Tax=Oratosquilla oratoria TaxID=337810 RepID=UPI003F7706F9